MAPWNSLEKWFRQVGRRVPGQAALHCEKSSAIDPEHMGTDAEALCKLFGTSPGAGFQQMEFAKLHGFQIFTDDWETSDEKCVILAYFAVPIVNVYYFH